MVAERIQNEGAEPTFFFVHVMKTGGTTFVQHIYRNFEPHEIFPGPEPGPSRREAYFLLEHLRQLSPERQRDIRVFAGHFPYVAIELLDTDVITLTLLRDPVERTVSVLRHLKRQFERLQDLRLEEIYEDAYVYPLYIRDHQAKVFSMTTDDKLESHFDVIEVDSRRLEVAKANLERVGILGLRERYDEFVDEMRLRFDWRFDPVKNQQVSTEGWDVTPAFRQRIAADNAADLDFYDYANALYRQRRGG